MALNPNQFHMRLYHGTSSKNVDRIKAAGVGGNTGFEPSVYLTNDYGLAHYYANTAADQEGGKPAIAEVRVNPRNLEVDWNSFEDPVYASEFGARQRSFDPSKLRDEMKDWKNSLKQAGAAVHRGKISPENIVKIEELDN